ATSGSYSQSFAITPTQVSDLRAGLLYFNIHNVTFPGGEIRGQLTEVQAPPTSGATPGSAPEPIATPPSFTG
ncbi:MAG TPA: CHRD domain-containing protein, partial [Acidimicrobiia bacterium]|nr:CHRD domain-containing protein [Acidimicrobiia bacterium]